MDNGQRVESKSIARALSHRRATVQLLPALKEIKTAIENELDGPAAATDGGGKIDDPGAFPFPPSGTNAYSKTDDDRNINRGVLKKLLIVLEPSGAVGLPTLRIDFPKRGGRVSGSVVPVIVEVRLGKVLEGRLSDAVVAAEEAEAAETEAEAKSTPDAGNSAEETATATATGTTTGTTAATSAATKGGVDSAAANDTPTKGETEFSEPRETDAAEGEAESDEKYQTRSSVLAAGKLPTGRFTARQQHGGEPHTTLPAQLAAPLDHCETRILVDGSEIARVPVASSGTTVVHQGLSVEYPPRCGDHPEKVGEVGSMTARAQMGVGGTAAARRGMMGEESSWSGNLNAMSVEARTVDRVCTEDVFGLHEIHIELACCRSSGGYSGGDDGEQQHGIRAAAAGKGETKTTPRSTSPLPSLSCEVFAITPSVEYFHTALGRAPSPLPPAAYAPSGRDVEGGTTVGAERGIDATAAEAAAAAAATVEPAEEFATVASLEPIPESVSVTVYLEGAFEAAKTIVTVSRWGSDGEVWEVCVAVE